MVYTSANNVDQRVNAGSLQYNSNHENAGSRPSHSYQTSAEVGNTPGRDNVWRTWPAKLLRVNHHQRDAFVSELVHTYSNLM
jgi:hypothetical protein